MSCYYSRMDVKKIICFLFIIFALPGINKAQLVGFRIATNSGMMISEFGKSDNPHPIALANSPAQSSEKFTPQLSYGFEGEILFQISDRGFFGIELDYSTLKGHNDNPPYYNYYLTSYFKQFQDEYYLSPIKYNTTLINLAVNYKYFFFPEKSFQPFVKLTGVVAFVGTDLMYKDFPNEIILPGIDPEKADYVMVPGADILYARGTSNSEQKKWPAFHGGIGIGVSYDISNNLAFQVDGTTTVINSGIINGVPTFTYDSEANMLRYNRRLALTMQISVGLAYTFEIGGGSRSGGKIDPNLPFYRNKN